jgi:hypothetical protein
VRECCSESSSHGTVLYLFESANIYLVEGRISEIIKSLDCQMSAAFVTVIQAESARGLVTNRRLKILAQESIRVISGS